MNIKNKYLIISLGVVTLLLFAVQPFVLDLIEPSKSIGQLIGDNAKDLVNALKGESVDSVKSSRQIWANIITIFAFISFAVSLALVIVLFNNKSLRWYAIIGAVLSIIGFVFYFTHLFVGLIGFVIIAILATLVALIVLS